ncbi:SET domain protein [Aspergillus tanneri]|uniref:SET domain-containing protein n=1 Tax=Aspergillus tanneri TaxID=1220188 RepID=A0A5M9MXH6_9EURO|nr:uncharacterized protein ATNIH1004_005835 [Aspergillus tanneri]KAA8647147.1 hypothetical protein ATNIH1004_005835 [Aspergillus tanneri]
MSNLLQVAKKAYKKPDYHPQHYMRTLEGRLRKPIPGHNGHLQIHINQSIFNPEHCTGLNWTVRWKMDGNCIYSTRATHACTKRDFLLEAWSNWSNIPSRGSESGCWANLRRDILAEFVGEIRSTDYDGHANYPCGIFTKVGMIVQRHCSPQKYSNWTRYINRSCCFSIVFDSRAIGNSKVMTVEAIRDISIFEEFTVDYGRQYWEDNDLECKCGETN